VRKNPFFGEKMAKKKQKAKANSPAGKKAKAEKAPEEKPAEKKPKKGKGKKKGKKELASLVEKNYIAVSVVLFVLVAGVGIGLMPGQEEASVEDFWVEGQTVSGEGKVKMIVVTSKKCPGCEVNNSLEVLLNKSGIEFITNEFSDGEEDGARLIKATGAKKLPLYLIEEESLTDAMIVKTESGFAKLKDVLHYYVDRGKGNYQEGFFAFPEMELDGQLRPKILLGETCGTKDNIFVQWFADPYDPNSISRSKDFENMRLALEAEKPFDVNSYFEYSYLPTYSLILEKDILKTFGGSQETVKRNIQMPAKYLICANDVFGTEAFNKLEQGLYSTYCEIDENTMAGTSTKPLHECSDSNHYNILLTADEVVEAAEKAGIYNDLVFSACLYNVDEKIGKIALIAEAAEITRTPKLLINCEYEVPMVNAYNALCTLNPELGFCYKG